MSNNNTTNDNNEESSSMSNSETKQLTSEKKHGGKPWYRRLHKLETKTYLKIVFILLVIVLIGLAIVFNMEFQKGAISFLKWMRRNPELGAFVFMLVYFLATVLFIPGSILTIGCGIVFAQVVGQVGGLFLGTLVVFIGATTGASAAFIIARYVLRDTIESKTKSNKTFGIIDKVVEINGLKVTFLLRLAPVVPFNLFNYFMGITSVSFKDYNLSHLGLLPGTMVYVFLGTTLSSIADASGAGIGSNTSVLIVFIVLLIVAFIGIFVISFYAKKEFNKIVKELEEKEKKETKQKEELLNNDIEEDPEATNDPETPPQDPELGTSNTELEKLNTKEEINGSNHV